jgi:hypothetical protein
MSDLFDKEAFERLMDEDDVWLIESDMVDISDKYDDELSLPDDIKRYLRETCGFVKIKSTDCTETWGYPRFMSTESAKKKLPDPYWGVGKDREYTKKVDCGSYTVRLYYLSPISNSLVKWSLKGEKSIKFRLDGTPGCCSNWFRRSEKLKYTYSLSGCYECGFSKESKTYSDGYGCIIPEFLTLLCKECAMCECGGKFRFRRGKCRKTKILLLLALRSPITFGRLPKDLIQFLATFLT